MKTKLCLSLAAALMLSACVVVDDDYERDRDYGRYEDSYEDRYDDRYDRRDERRDRDRRSTRYECRNGLSVTVRQINSDRIELRLDGKRTVMQSAVSGSGSRYVSNRGLFGTGAEWHEKGGNAALEFKDPYGNVVETSCRAS